MDGLWKKNRIDMRVCDCIVGLVTSIKKAENLKSCYQKSLTDLESFYGALSQQAFKGEPNLSRIQQDVRQPEEGRSE